MKKIILIVFTCIALHAKGQHTITYKDYLRLRGTYLSALNSKDTSAKNLLPKFLLSARSIDNLPDAYVDVAECYLKLQNKDSALYYLGKAFEYGANANNIDYKLFRTYIPGLAKRFDSLKLRSKVNAALKNRLLQMSERDQQYRQDTKLFYDTTQAGIIYRQKMQMADSQNRAELEYIINQYGWPEKQSIGQGAFEAEQAPALITIHSPEGFNEYCLALAMDKAKRNLSSWTLAERIMQNLLFRFPVKWDTLHIHKLPHLIYTVDLIPDTAASFFTLYCLSLAKKGMPPNTVIELFATDSSTVRAEGLNRIKNFLISYGINAAEIRIRSDIKLDKETVYQLGTPYAYAFIMTRSKPKK